MLLLSSAWETRGPNTHERNRHNFGFHGRSRRIAPPPFGFGTISETKFHGPAHRGQAGRRKAQSWLMKPIHLHERIRPRHQPAPCGFTNSPPATCVVVPRRDWIWRPGKLRVKTRRRRRRPQRLAQSWPPTWGPDFRRVRLGIGHPGGQGPKVLSWVLKDFRRRPTLAWRDPLIDAVVPNQLPDTGRARRRVRPS